MKIITSPEMFYFERQVYFSGHVLKHDPVWSGLIWLVSFYWSGLVSFGWSNFIGLVWSGLYGLFIGLVSFFSFSLFLF